MQWSLFKKLMRKTPQKVYDAPAGDAAEELVTGDGTEAQSVAPQVSELDVPSEAVARPADKPISSFERWKRQLKETLERKKAAGSDKNRGQVIPIRIIIGYLPEVSERDALEYTFGIAEKHFEQLGMAYFEAFKYASGYAFEAHEGGSGRAFLPEILKHFDAMGPFNPEHNEPVIIRTATRAVEVQRQRDGLVAIVLPEAMRPEQPEWLEATTRMQPALNKRTGLLVVGAALFTTGFIAMMTTSMLTRFQEWEPAPQATVEYINVSQLPSGQWAQLQSVPQGSYVKSLRFENGHWTPPDIATEAPTAPTPPSPDASAPAAAPEIPLPGSTPEPKAPTSLNTPSAQGNTP